MGFDPRDRHREGTPPCHHISDSQDTWVSWELNLLIPYICMFYLDTAESWPWVILACSKHQLGLPTVL